MGGAPTTACSRIANPRRDGKRRGGALAADWENIMQGRSVLVIDVSAGPRASNYPYEYSAGVPADGWSNEHRTTKIVLRLLPAGFYTMGSPTGELRRHEDEVQHEVTLTKGFHIGVFAVTQKQWERVTGDWPSHFENVAYRDARPVEEVSWNLVRGGTWPGESAGDGSPETNTFIQKLRDRTGLPFDLPTEAQWEYACRAETSTALNSGKEVTGDCCPNMGEVARYFHSHPDMYSGGPGADCDRGTAMVGNYRPNTWGLCDMHGNVREFCLDWYTTTPAGGVDPLGPHSGSKRVVRGGSWLVNASYCRSAKRDACPPEETSFGCGFRLCLPADSSVAASHQIVMTTAKRGVEDSNSGLTAENPIAVGGKTDIDLSSDNPLKQHVMKLMFDTVSARTSEEEYLSRLRCPKGSPVRYELVDNVKGAHGKPMGKFKIHCLCGNHSATVYLDGNTMGPEEPIEIPGWHIAQEP